VVVVVVGVFVVVGITIVVYVRGGGVGGVIIIGGVGASTNV